MNGARLGGVGLQTPGQRPRRAGSFSLGTRPHGSFRAGAPVPSEPREAHHVLERD